MIGALIAVVLIIAIVIGIVLLGIWLLVVGIYDTLFADKASIWSILYLVIGFFMVFGGLGGGGAAAVRQGNR